MLSVAHKLILSTSLLIIVFVDAFSYHGKRDDVETERTYDAVAERFPLYNSKFEKDEKAVDIYQDSSSTTQYDDAFYNRFIEPIDDSKYIDIQTTHNYKIPCPDHSTSTSTKKDCRFDSCNQKRYAPTDYSSTPEGERDRDQHYKVIYEREPDRNVWGNGGDSDRTNGRDPSSSGGDSDRTNGRDPSSPGGDSDRTNGRDPSSSSSSTQQSSNIAPSSWIAQMPSFEQNIMHEMRPSQQEVFYAKPHLAKDAFMAAPILQQQMAILPELQSTWLSKMPSTDQGLYFQMSPVSRNVFYNKPSVEQNNFMAAPAFQQQMAIMPTTQSTWIANQPSSDQLLLIQMSPVSKNMFFDKPSVEQANFILLTTEQKQAAILRGNQANAAFNTEKDNSGDENENNISPVLPIVPVVPELDSGKGTGLWTGKDSSTVLTYSNRGRQSCPPGMRSISRHLHGMASYLRGSVSSFTLNLPINPPRSVPPPADGNELRRGHLRGRVLEDEDPATATATATSNTTFTTITPNTKTISPLKVKIKDEAAPLNTDTTPINTATPTATATPPPPPTTATATDTATDTATATATATDTDTGVGVDIDLDIDNNNDTIGKSFEDLPKGVDFPFGW